MRLATLCVALLLLGCGGTTIPNDGGPGDGGVDAPPDAGDDGGSSLSGIAAGSRYTCAVSRGRTACWGLNLTGAVDGLGSTAVVFTPMPVAGVPPAIAPYASGLGRGDTQSCALTEAGDLYCWGSNSYGQIGNGMTSTVQMPVFPPTMVASGILKTACGSQYTCAVSSGGLVTCWGYGYAGQLGIGQSDGGSNIYPSPVTVPEIGGATDVATGDLTTCAIAAGDVWCWGQNEHGQVGDGTTTPRYTPVKLPSLSNVTSIAVGELHACAVAAGQVYCWGSDDRGQLGDGKPQAKSFVPVAVQGVPGAVAVTAGLVHTCALTQAGAVYCWGGNDWGNVGDGTVMTERDTPVLVAGLPKATAVSAGLSHTCALLASGGAMCWGEDTYGELGDGVADGGTRLVPTPVAVVGLP